MNCPNCHKQVEGFIIRESLWVERWCNIDGHAEEYDITGVDPEVYIYCPKCLKQVFNTLEDLEKFLGIEEIIYNS